MSRLASFWRMNDPSMTRVGRDLQISLDFSFRHQNTQLALESL
jgi:hypothetical protein